MNFEQKGQLELTEEADLELKIVHAGKVYVVQAASPFMRATIVLDERYEKEDFLEISQLICNTIDDITIKVDENAPSL